VRRHRFHAISFFAGILFAVIGMAFLFGRIDVTDLRLSWVWPIPLIALGLLMLFTSKRRESSPKRERDIPEPDADGESTASLTSSEDGP
jgi:hypothetical protein